MSLLKDNFEYSPEMNHAIFALYGQGASSTRVASELGITRLEFDALREKNNAFNRVCTYGENLSEVALEKLAMEGARGEIKNFNATMMQFLLKNLYPEQYNDKRTTESASGTLLEQLTAGSLKLVRHSE